MSENISELKLLSELSEPAEKLLNHHFEVSKNWYPFEEVPYSLARSFDKDNPWQESDYPLDPGVRSAIFVNLLTEDNLPYYTHTILSLSDKNHPLYEWTHQWTSEEWRHSAVIRDWVHATRAIDPKELEDARKIQMKLGEVPEPETLADMLIYTSLQELATQVAHRNTGKHLDKDLLGRRVMALVAGDEGLHHEFYSGLASAAFEIEPSVMVISALKQLKGFQMPGTGIPNFNEHSRLIEKSGIYNIPEFYENVVLPTFNKWDINNISKLSSDAEIARDKINRYISMLGKVSLRFKDRN
jgi:acyl-[acyl-carrier-protein] desaturase